MNSEKVEQLYVTILNLREALREIKIQTTEDIAGLPRDEALNVITWIRERAEAALKQEV
jgi:hypothetical protein